MQLVPAVCHVSVCCQETMICAGRTSSMSCKHMLSGDHVLFGSYQQYVM